MNILKIDELCPICNEYIQEIPHDKECLENQESEKKWIRNNKLERRKEKWRKFKQLFKIPFGKICPSCKKRKLYLSRREIKPKHLPPIRPNEPICNKCLNNLEKIY